MAYQSTLRGARGGLYLEDWPVSEELAIAILQTKIDNANSLIFTGNLPIIVSRGREMEAKARAEVMKIVHGAR